MAEDDRAYYRHRADTEAELAQQATMPCVVQAHHALAQAYRGKLASAEPAQARMA